MASSFFNASSNGKFPALAELLCAAFLGTLDTSRNYDKCFGASSLESPKPGRKDIRNSKSEGARLPTTWTARVLNHSLLGFRFFGLPLGLGFSLTSSLGTPI